MGTVRTLNDHMDKIWFDIKSPRKMYKNFGTGQTVYSKNEIPTDHYGIIQLHNKNLDNAFCIGTIENDDDGNLLVLYGTIRLNALIRGPQKREFSNCATIVINSKKEKKCYGRIPGYVDYWINAESTIVAAQKTFGTKYVLLGGNNFVELNCLSNITQFIDHKETLKKKGKTQDLIDELVKVTPPIDMDEKKPDGIIKKTYRYGGVEDTSKTYVMVSKLTDYKEPCVCIRSFIADLDDNCVLEGSRLYIMKNKTVFSKKNNLGDFVTAPAQYPYYWNHSMLEVDDNICEGTQLAYFNTIANEIPENKRMHMVFLCLKFPIVEKLYKAGFKNIVNIMLEECTRYYSRYNEIIQSHLGNVSSTEKNLYKAIGVNKYQLEKTDMFLADLAKNESCRFDCRFNIISMLKSCFPDIMSYSNDLFDKLFDLMVLGDYYRTEDILHNYIDLYSMESLSAKYEMIKKFMDSNNTIETELTFRNWRGEEYTRTTKLQTKNIMNDYLNMVKNLNDAAHFRFDFKDAQELLNAHNMVNEVYNHKKDEVIMTNFLNAVDKLKKYSFEDDQYSIVIPSAPEDLAFEGITLHHCVKSYISRVANGSTGIVFIREKKDLAAPFFTAEVQKGTIMQVHGFGNCNVTEPTLKKFIDKWVKNKKLALNPMGINIVR